MTTLISHLHLRRIDGGPAARTEVTDFLQHHSVPEPDSIVGFNVHECMNSNKHVWVLTYIGTKRRDQAVAHLSKAAGDEFYYVVANEHGT